MTRISLRETYDNRSVIAQIAKVTDTAEDAAETVQQKAAEINDALTDVNAAVQAAEGAVTTANAASASAQQSAQTVAGYENRLGAVEGDVVQLNTDLEGVESDLNAVTVRVQTAEGNILTIQGQITALQTADGQNVKINAINQYAVGLTGNQSGITGNKGFLGNIQVGDNDHPLTGGVVAVTNGAYRRIRLQNIADDATIAPASSVGYPIVAWTDVNDVNICTLVAQHQPDGKTRLVTQLRNVDGTNKLIVLGVSD